MKRFKIAAVIGARPQFIKAAAIVRAYKVPIFKNKLDIFWIHTGQHYDHRLSNIFFKELLIPKPKYHLGVGSLPQGAQTGLMMQKIESVLIKESPDAVLVFGDTNSTLAGALAAAKLCVPVFHVEAGLRSFNWAMPEEINRVVTDRISSLLFCPTTDSLSQLKREGLGQRAHVVGDVMADILYFYKTKLSSLMEKKPYYLATIHRSTNTDDQKRLESILKALTDLRHRIIFPLHPRTRNKIKSSPVLTRLLRTSLRIKIIDPVSYLEMLNLEKHADGIITDSGGVQKEAWIWGIPCVTLRRETEWRETVQRGLNTLCEPDATRIKRAFQKMKSNKSGRKSVLYGSGNASSQILKIMIQYLSKYHRKKI